MKKLFTILLLLNFQNYLTAQTTENWVDNIGCGFNCPGCCINLGQSPYWECWEIDSANPENIWQNGTYLGKPFLGPRGFVTDSVNPYPPNNNSSFEFMVADYPEITDCFGMFLIHFNHTFDTDTMYDGGYLEISFDNKQTWYNIIDTVPHFILDSTADYSLENMYGNSDTLWNGQKGFSGRKELFASEVIFTLKPQYNCSIDTIYLRFTFISDSTDNQREGWKIDNIDLTVSEGEFMQINSVYGSKTNFQIPTILHRCSENYILINLPGKLFARISDITGKAVSIQEITGNNFWLDCNIIPGIYAITLYNNEFSKTEKVFIK